MSEQLRGHGPAPEPVELEDLLPPWPDARELLVEVPPFELDEDLSVELVEVGRGVAWLQVGLLVAIAAGVGILVARDRG